MKFQVGDKVLLLHSNEEGEVVEIINKKMVEVEVGGVRFPVFTDQIDFPYFKRFTAKSKPSKIVKTYIDQLKKEISLPSNETEKEYGVYLIFFPVFNKDIFDDDIVEYFKVYIINHTSTAYLFTYELTYQKNEGFQLKNELLPGQDCYVHNIPFENLNDGAKISVEFTLKVPDKKKATHYETTIKIKAKQIFDRIEQLLLKQEASFSYLLMEHYPDKTENDKLDLGKLSAAGFHIYDASKAKQSTHPPRSVIDLHIDKITNDWKGLSNYEILSLQLKEFEKFYDLAIQHLQPNLIVIHGVGEGVLRDEIHQILKYKKEVKSFVNQYHPKYGNGATEIYFQY
jgi:hypothetical protein